MHDDLAVDHNRAALLSIVAMLFAAAGIGRGGVAASLPRRVRSLILRSLRPAESAVRRLIVIVASTLSVAAGPKRPAPTKTIPRGSAGAARLPAFPLFDSRKRFAERRARMKGMPQISFFGAGDRVAVTPTPDPSPDDAIDAGQMCRRLEALARALEDLPKQARRLLRAQAQRKHAPPGPRRVGPIRPGWPPGYRQRHKLPVDSVLYNCHVFALRALEPPRRSPTDSAAA